MTTASTPNDLLTQVVRASRVLRPEVVDALAEQAGNERVPLDQVLLREAGIARADLLRLLENHFFCAAIDVAGQPYDPALLALVPHRLARRHLVLPVGRADGTLRVAFANPDDKKAREAVAREARLEVLALVALPGDLDRAVREHYTRFEKETAAAENTTAAGGSQARRGPDAQPRATEPGRGRHALDCPADDAVKIVDLLLRHAVQVGATDVHLQPEEDGLAVRLRVDGLLQTVATVPTAAMPSVLSRVKIVAAMNIAERRLPQDGRFTLQSGNEQLDLRVSSLPSQFGEKIVIRLLRKNLHLLTLDNLKMPPAVRDAYRDAIDAAIGFFLVTGPTGSGKTTTLYATLNALDRTALNVTTLENPIEYQLRGLTQVQIQEDVGLTFAAGLRSILRQDPNVILVGEIRDLETVEIACRAALTGHKVYSTLHTNDACSAVARLLDMGIAPHLIAATLRGVLAQRLVRTLCAECKITYEPNATERALLGSEAAKLQRGAGCGHCGGTGYKGRMALFEYFRVDEAMQRLIMERSSPFALRHAAARRGMITMAEFARRAALAGATTVAEIQRVILADEGKEQVCSGCQRAVSIEYMVCPFCRHVLKETCGSCGAPVEPSWEACPGCGTELAHEGQRAYCRHCFAPVGPSWHECRYCGGQL
jgi:type IV pilus assembly protein PilB